MYWLCRGGARSLDCNLVRSNVQSYFDVGVLRREEKINNLERNVLTDDHFFETDYFEFDVPS